MVAGAPERLTVTPEPVFHHAWEARLAGVPPLDPLSLSPSPTDTVLVVVAHPDDETLAMGGTLAALAASGTRVEVVSLTSGEAALDHLGIGLPDLARRRAGELERAAAALGVADAVTLELPDGDLSAFEPEAAAVVEAAARRSSAARLLTLWPHDPHPDHRAAARAAAGAAGHLGLPVTTLGLWALHWTDPDTVMGPACPVLLDGRARERRDAALACYRSQTEPLLDGVEPVLPAAVLGWPHEVALEATVLP